MGIIVLCVGAGALPSTVGTIEKKTVYPNHTSGENIQGLIDNASDGDTIYIPSGIYYENIIINKSINLVGEDKNTTIIDGGGSGDVAYVSADWVNISGFTIQNSGNYGDPYYDGGIDIRSKYNNITGNNFKLNKQGIILRNDNNAIVDNILTDNDCGLALHYSKSNNSIIISNNITNNNNYGLYLGGSNNIISGNTINSNNWDGIRITSDSNIISGNIINSNCEDGISLDIDSNYNTITGNAIINNEDGIGIILSSSNNNTISDNNISNSLVGIYLGESCSNIITGNTILVNGDGLAVRSSSNNNTIAENTISDNNNGMLLYDSSKTIVRNNAIQDNTCNFNVVGDLVSEFYHDIDTSNTINGKPIYYLLEKSNLLLDDLMNIGYLGLVTCKNVSIKNIKITNNGDGVLLVNTSLSTIENLTLLNNTQEGIYFFLSSDNNITNNYIVSNNNQGILLEYSNRNTITGNIISSNNNYGIYLLASRDNIFASNIISNHGHGIIFRGAISNNIIGTTIKSNNAGIVLWGSSNNNITRNNITNNSDGIYLSRSSYNIITKNIISNNNRGIYLTWSIIFGNIMHSSSNKILSNNFLDNKQDAFFRGGILTKKNTWNNNYWGRPRLLPKPIFGVMTPFEGSVTIPLVLPWINVDWRPALKPYDI